MTSESHSPVVAVNSEAPDDIRALAEAFSLQNWRYVDIARQERLQAIVARWPLLAECATVAADEGK